MKKIELYEVDDVIASTFEYCMLLPDGNGNLKLYGENYFTRILRNNNGKYEYTRNLIRDEAPGCDVYCILKNGSDNSEMRKELSLSKTTISLLDDGTTQIEDKRYFILRSIDKLPVKITRKFASNKVWFNNNESNYSIKYTKPDNNDYETGYLVTGKGIQKIIDEGFKESVLTEDNFVTFIQKGMKINPVNIEEALDTVVTYKPGEGINTKPSNLSAT